MTRNPAQGLPFSGFSGPVVGLGALFTSPRTLFPRRPLIFSSSANVPLPNLAKIVFLHSELNFAVKFIVQQRSSKSETPQLQLGQLTWLEFINRFIGLQANPRGGGEGWRPPIQSILRTRGILGRLNIK